MNYRKVLEEQIEALREQQPNNSNEACNIAHTIMKLVETARTTGTLVKCDWACKNNVEGYCGLEEISLRTTEVKTGEDSSFEGMECKQFEWEDEEK